LGVPDSLAEFVNDADTSQLKGTAVDWDTLAPTYLKANDALAAEREAKAKEIARKFAEERGRVRGSGAGGAAETAGAKRSAPSAGAATSAAGAAAVGADDAADDPAAAAAMAAATRQAEETATRQAAAAAAPRAAPAHAPSAPSHAPSDGAAESAAAAAKTKGNAAFAAKNHPSAVAFYTLGLASDPESAVLHSNRAAALSGLGLFHEALRDADEAARLDPAWAKAHLRRGAVLASLGRHAEAVKAYKTAMHFDPNAAATTTTRENLSTAEAKAAAAAAGAAWDPDPSPVEASTADALDEKAKGNAAFSAGDHVTAVGHYVAAVAAAPDNAVLYSNRAAALLGMRAFADAEQSARKCVELDPSFAKGYGRLAEALRLTGKKSEARRALEKGLDQCQGNAALQEALDALLLSFVK
jgi:tetratricopeptide (TPR) repeat protein